MGGFDLDAYLARIGVNDPVKPDLETLRRIHLAHLTSIVFENLDIHLGKPIKVDLPSVEAKLVGARRGGYCFELNTLLAGALEAIGFDVTMLGARVGPGDPATLMRDHLVLRVRADGDDYLCDVGFGVGALYEPLRMRAGETVDQYGRGARLIETPSGLTLQVRGDAGWEDQYQFTMEEMFYADVVMANHYTSTYPDGGFVRVLTVQREDLNGQWILRDKTLKVSQDGATTRRILRSDDERLSVISELFGLSFPPGTVFRSPNDVRRLWRDD